MKDAVKGSHNHLTERVQEQQKALVLACVQETEQKYRTRITSSTLKRKEMTVMTQKCLFACLRFVSWYASMRGPIELPAGPTSCVC